MRVHLAPRVCLHGLIAHAGLTKLQTALRICSESDGRQCDHDDDEIEQSKGTHRLPTSAISTPVIKAFKEADSNENLLDFEPIRSGYETHTPEYVVVAQPLGLAATRDP
jgi:hypothetical protein